MDQFINTQIHNALEEAAVHRAKNAARNLGQPENLGKIEQTAQEFEAVFIAEMMKPMFAGIETNGVFGGGKGEEVFRSMLVSEYGKLLANTGTIGLADHVKAEMIRLQESQNPKQTQPAIGPQEIIDVEDLNESEGENS